MTSPADADHAAEAGGASRAVLALNSGSSSLKFGLYTVSARGALARIVGEASAIGTPEPRFEARDGAGRSLAVDVQAPSTQADALAAVAGLLDHSQTPRPSAIGHRIVHGGPRLLHHRLIDDATLRDLERAASFAPLHVPPALAIVRFAQEHFPGVPQVACFDTAFHRDLPPVARTLPLPGPLRDLGLHRYGFHGLSCESILRRLGDDAPARLIIAHLGGGASVTAVRDGRSIDTSMGLTPSGGVIMGTRSGDIDPGVLAGP